ncbi:TPA: hypothetical protein HA235_05305 [Candidatus Woesearchaeota archaeon]|nr:hypothetical protein [Candidatus Woesearchaeota archaeon]HIH32097.1 hypothetical protein [Candidatus Woesearchaeota archaeon]HIH54913.1 hypothetical protein [Candidatus Woesearchaeota archaeon]HIJ01796.1 hypothetical protein [Candidatus Woesearchaeota archaeon]HIJ14031.1 hypothetical protein [Candidatus Woesearchaeota archaeon]
MNEKIIWCINQGMKLLVPDDDLAEEYYKSSEETLMVGNLIKNSGSNMWLATQKYYAEYLAAYSLLMKIGIKSEIHSCTIEVIRIMEELGIIKFKFSDILEQDKGLRTDNQYYLKNIPINFDSKLLAKLLLDVRSILNTINQDQIMIVREHIFRKIYKA